MAYRNKAFLFLGLIYTQPQIKDPTIVRVNIQYPEWIQMYFQDFLSNKPFIPIMGKAKNRPEINPCKAPCLKVLKAVP